jgi:Fe2+ or Zn2+ uptake regulation protein
VRTREAIEQRLNSLGVRSTKARRSVLEVLEAAEGPITASELQTRVDPVIPLSSLYRTLGVLTESQLLANHHGVDGVTRFELAEWLTGHHHHVVCSHCGEVTDVDFLAEHEARLEHIAEEIASLNGFLATSHTLELVGICGRFRT